MTRDANMQVEPEPPMTPAIEILKALIGHDHQCYVCIGDKNGCINCRYTGREQTPCELCHKDGIDEKRIADACIQLHDEIAACLGGEEPNLIEDSYRGVTFQAPDYVAINRNVLRAQIDAKLKKLFGMEES